MLARLGLQALLRLEYMAVSGPGVRCSAWNLSVPEVLRSRLAVLRRELELRSGFVVEASGVVTRIGQFQTLTSR